ncbi:MAG: DUF2911 domain-containing protein [Gemmatimonadaceae bacterium]
MKLVATCMTIGALGLVPSAAAQTIPFSQRATVSQSVGFTQIAVDYGRPTARGRTIFPGVVAWGRVWNPGADSATRVGFEHDVRVNGRALAAGDYSIWVIPREQGPWSVIFHRAGHVFHTPYPGDDGVAARLEVTPERGDHMEALAIYFPSVTRDSAVMRIHWGTTVLPLSIVAPWRPASSDDRYFLNSDFGNSMWTPTLPSTSWVIRRSAAMLAS